MCIGLCAFKPINEFISVWLDRACKTAGNLLIDNFKDEWVIP